MDYEKRPSIQEASHEVFEQSDINLEPSKVWEHLDHQQREKVLTTVVAAILQMDGLLLRSSGEMG